MFIRKREALTCEITSRIPCTGLLLPVGRVTEPIQATKWTVVVQQKWLPSGTENCYMTTVATSLSAISNGDVASPESTTILSRHRRVWERKPSLRAVYHSYFRMVVERLAHTGPTVELGCGPGYFHEYHPDSIPTDVAPSPWARRVVNACQMPFDNGSVGNLVLVDVFHHIARPLDFLNEAMRVLRPGGRVVMLEPWTSAFGAFFYRYVHHEGSRGDADPIHPFADEKDAWDGNAALVRIWFDPRRGAYRESLPDGLRLFETQLIPAMSWLATAGFQEWQPIPTALQPLTRWFEVIAAPFSRWIALRALITMERA